MVLNIPHSSKHIPDDLRQQFILSEDEISAELNRMTDSFTDELFVCRNATRIIFPVSRLVIDPERFLDDDKEPMSAVGMGVVYTRTSHGIDLRSKLTDADKQQLVDRYYIQHHNRLTQAVKAELEIDQQCLIIDCHSFPSLPLPYETDKSPVRPAICLGTDDFHTPSWLREMVQSAFTLWGFKTELNFPFSGTIVPMAYYRNDANVASIMIEVNRHLYMNENTGVKSQFFEEVQNKISTILNMLNEMFANHK